MSNSATVSSTFTVIALILYHSAVFDFTLNRLPLPMVMLRILMGVKLSEKASSLKADKNRCNYFIPRAYEDFNCYDL